MSTVTDAKIIDDLSLPETKVDFDIDLDLLDREALVTLLHTRSQEAYADLVLEDIHPTREGLCDMVLLDWGKLTEDQFLARAVTRASS